MTFRAGDHALHVPTGESWLLACDEHEGMVIAAGYPDRVAAAEEWALLETASDGQRLAMLRLVAGSGSAEQLARRQLARAQSSHVDGVSK
jgi:hypothetical protein